MHLSLLSPLPYCGDSVSPFERPDLLFDRDLDECVGPTALESATALPSPVVGYQVQNILSRLTERRRSGGLPAETRALDFRRLFDRHLRITERDRARAAKFTPRQRDGRRLRLPHAGNQLGVIAD